MFRFIAKLSHEGCFSVNKKQNYFRKLSILVLIVAVSVSSFASTAVAAPNLQINYQGKLTDSSGNAVSDGDYQIVFNLYTASSGGSAIWTESHSGANEITVTSGLFSVMLGSITSLASIDFNQTLYLGVTVEADTEMTPRKILGTVPAAFEARKLDGASVSDLLSATATNATGTITNFNFTNGIGDQATITAATSTSFFSTLGRFTTGVINTLTATVATITDLTATNFIATNSTTTNATTTSFFAGTASSTNLFTSNLSIGSLSGILKATAGSVTTALVDLTADVTGVLPISNGGTNASSLSSANPLWFDGTRITGTSTPVASRFIATSTSEASVLPYASSTSITTTAGTWLATSGGTLGVGTTSPSSSYKLSVHGSVFSSGIYYGQATAPGMWFDETNGSVLKGAYFILDDGDFQIQRRATNFGAYEATPFRVSISAPGSSLVVNSAGNVSIPYASSTSMTISGTAYIGSLNGPLQANNGQVSATSSVGVVYGGTGATTFGQGWIFSNGGTGALSASTSPTVNYFTATSTSQASTFPYASSTALTVSGSAYLATSGGSVGIGTTNPDSSSSKLQINSDTGIRLVATDSSNMAWIYTSLRNFAMSVSSGNDYKTTFNNTASGLHNVDVKGVVRANYFTATSTTASTFPYASTTAITVSGNAYFPGSGIWNSTGYVGIGTTSPNRALTVQSSGSGDVTIDNTNTSGYAGIVFQNTSSPSLTIGHGGASYGTWGNNGFISSTNDLIFATNNLYTRVMTLTSGGLVGIGTSSPYAKLSVVGQVVGEYFTATSSTASVFPYASSTSLTVSGSTYLATSGGRVGIGTTSPQAVLNSEVAGNNFGLLLTNLSGATNRKKIGFGADTESKQWQMGTDSGNDGTDDFWLWARGTGFIQTWLDNGNVGIGKTIPATTLDVFGTASSTALQVNGSGTFLGTLAVGGGTTIPTVPSGYGAIISAVGQSSGAAVGGFRLTHSSLNASWDFLIGGVSNSLAGDLAFCYNGSACALVLQQGGNVGIGDTDADFALETVGTVGVSSAAASDGDRFVITANGRVGIGSTTPGSILSIGSSTTAYINLSATATSTFYSGIDVKTGCFAVNGTCISGGGGGGSGTVNSGTTGNLAYYTGSTAVSSADMYWDATNRHLGIATTTANGFLFVNKINTGDYRLSPPYYTNSTSTYISVGGTTQLGITAGPGSNTYISNGGDSSTGTSGDAGNVYLAQGGSTSGTVGADGRVVIGRKGTAFLETFGTIYSYGSSAGLNIYGSGLLNSGTSTSASNKNGLALKISSGSDTGSATGGSGASVSISVGGSTSGSSQTGGAGGTVNISNGGSSSNTGGTGGAGGTINLVQGGLDTDSSINHGNDGTVNIGNSSGKKNANLYVYGTINTMLKGTATANGICHSDPDFDTASTTAVVSLVACSGAPGDIAEMYPTEPAVEEGDIVAVTDNLLSYQAQGSDAITGQIKQLGQEEVSILKKADGTSTIIGVVSTGPFQTFGKDVNNYADHKNPVALVGRVPVKVNMEGGDIRPGDRIALSSIPGVGKKASSTLEVTIGIALNSFDEGDIESDGVGKVLVFVNLEPGSLSGAAIAASTGDGLWTVDEETGEMIAFGVINMNGKDIKNVRSISGISGIWSIDEEGKLVVEHLEVRGSATFGSPDRRIGITLYDEQTGDPYCLSIADGQTVTRSGMCSEQVDEVIDTGSGSGGDAPVDDATTTDSGSDPVDSTTDGSSGDTTPSDTPAGDTPVDSGSGADPTPDPVDEPPVVEDPAPVEDPTPTDTSGDTGNATDSGDTATTNDNGAI